MSYIKGETSKSVASVADVARLVGLSRERFYQLQRCGVFPLPIYDVNTRRPHYTDEMQHQCIVVRETNCGINGQPILFYSKGSISRARANKSSTQIVKSKGNSVSIAPSDKHGWLLEGLNGLGCTATQQQVDASLKMVRTDASPISENEHGVLIAKVFREIKRQNRIDNVHR